MAVTDQSALGQSRAVSAQDRLSIWAKIYILSVIIPIAFDVGTLVLSVNRIVLLLLIVPLGLRVISGGLGRFFWVDYMLLLYVGWSAVSLAVNNPDAMVEAVGSEGLELLGGYLVGRCFIRTRAQFYLMCRFLGLTALCLLPLALIESLTRQIPVIEFLRSVPGIRTEALVFNDERLGMRRAQVVFAHPIHFGLFCSVSFTLFFVAMKDRMPDFRRILFSALIAFAGFLSLSSGAILAMAVQGGLVAWNFLFRKNAKRWYILTGLVCLGIGVVAIISGDSPIRVFMRYASFSAHNAFWRGIIFEYGMLNVWANPIFGLGLNDWFRPSFMPSGSIDNFWLQIAVRYGFPGFFLMIIPYLWVLWRITTRDFGDDQTLKTLRYAWMFCFLGLTFTLATVAIWKAIFSFFFFAFGAGIWLIRAEPEGDAEEVVPEPEPVSRYTRFPTVPARTPAE